MVMNFYQSWLSEVVNLESKAESKMPKLDLDLNWAIIQK